MRRFVLVAVLVCALAPAASAGGDPMRAQQWGLDRIGAPVPAEVATGAGTTIAVVDTGVDASHEDLRFKLVDGLNLIEPGRPPADDEGHGTHVSGIAAAATGNGVGIAGVAPDARIMPIRALNRDGGSASDVDAAIRWAADRGATVINLSIGEDIGLLQTVLGSSLTDAIEYAWSKGSIPVIAAGNDAYPSGYGNIHAVVVVATTPDDVIADYSNSSGGLLRDARWAVAAPGGAGDGNSSRDVLSTYWASGKANQYAFAAGTSMATPHVSGALALLRGRGLSPQQAIDRLLSTAKDLGSRGRDPTYGSGRIDVAKAVAGLGSPGQPSPAPATQPPGGGPAQRRTAAPATSVVVTPTPTPTPPPGTAIASSASPSGTPVALASRPPAAPARNRSGLVAAAGALLAAAGGVVLVRRLRA